MYRAKTEKCLIAIRKFLDEPSDKIERPNLTARLGNFRFEVKKQPPQRTAYNINNVKKQRAGTETDDVSVGSRPLLVSNANQGASTPVPTLL